MNKLLTEIIEWIKSLIIAIIIALFINIFIFELSVVDGQSMLPTLHNKDRVFALKHNFILNYDFDYGDIVIIDSKVNQIRTFLDEVLDSSIIRNIRRDFSRDFWVKRVIGKGGDTIEIKDGKLYRNSVLINEDYINEEMKSQDVKFIVPENYIFVMGDNRNFSNDSRYIGPVPIENVRAKVLYRVFPLSSIKKF